MPRELTSPRARAPRRDGRSLACAVEGSPAAASRMSAERESAKFGVHFRITSGGVEPTGAHAFSASQDLHRRGLRVAVEDRVDVFPWTLMSPRMRGVPAGIPRGIVLDRGSRPASPAAASPPEPRIFATSVRPPHGTRPAVPARAGPRDEEPAPGEQTTMTDSLAPPTVPRLHVWCASLVFLLAQHCDPQTASPEALSSEEPAAVAPPGARDGMTDGPPRRGTGTSL